MNSEMKEGAIGSMICISYNMCSLVWIYALISWVSN